MKNLKPGSHVHLMGICGTAMGSFAGLLKESGFHITGSDTNIYPPMSDQLKALGIEIKQGYVKENLDPKPDYVIVGNVITRKYEEAQALLKSDIPYSSFPKSIGDFLIEGKKSVVLCGTHGKTTSTSMAAWVAESMGEKPGFLVGGIPLNFQKSFQVPDGDIFIIEGDEYDTAFFDKVPKFNHYHPKYVVLTSVEFDHVDIYKDLGAVLDAFKQLMERLPEDGVLMINGTDQNISKIIEYTKCKNIKTYGFGDFDYSVSNIQWSQNGVEFDILKHGKKLAHPKLNVIGDYNILNALSIFGLYLEMGFSKEKIVQGLETFQGVKRRQEIIGTPNGVTLIDDFAHHPTAVQLTVEAVQKRYLGQKVFSVFEPRSATSRRNVFEEEYFQAFQVADHLLLPEVFNKDVLEEDERLPLDKIIGKLKALGKDVQKFDSVDEIVSYLKESAKSGDVILIMSNGGFDGIYKKLL